jgi:hypothetical protein
MKYFAGQPEIAGEWLSDKMDDLLNSDTSVPAPRQLVSAMTSDLQTSDLQTFRPQTGPIRQLAEKEPDCRAGKFYLQTSRSDRPPYLYRYSVPRYSRPWYSTSSYPTARRI